MANFGERVAKGWKEIRGNLAVEMAKWIGGSTVVGAIFKAISQSAHRLPVDWLLFICLLICGLLLILFSFYRGGEQKEETRTGKTKDQTSLDLDREIRGPTPVREDELLRANECYRRCLEEKKDLERACNQEKQEYATRCLEYRAELARYADLFSPLQMEAFQLAHELRSFLSDLGATPLPMRDGKVWQHDGSVEWMVARNLAEDPWDMKLFHGYANREFGKRITSLMHRAGEQYEYPAHVPNYAETISPSKDALAKLAQEMEMLAIWINRKQHNEVDMLHEKH